MSAKDWPKVKLGDVAKVFAGSSAPQGDDNYADEGPRFIRARHVGESNGASCLTGVGDHLAENVPRYRNMKKARRGSTLFPKSGASVATNARVKLGEDAFFVSHLMAVEPDKECLDEDYLFWWLNTIDMMAVGSNAAYPSVNQSTVKALRIPLPPLEEQRAIAKRLSEQMEQVAAARQAARAQLEWIDALPSAILREVFGADT